MPAHDKWLWSALFGSLMFIILLVSLVQRQLNELTIQQNQDYSADVSVPTIIMVGADYYVAYPLKEVNRELYDEITGSKSASGIKQD